MDPCDKPLADQTLREAANCAWDNASKAFSAVVDHPATASMAEWTTAVLAGLVALFFLSLILRLLTPFR